MQAERLLYPAEKDAITIKSKGVAIIKAPRVVSNIELESSNVSSNASSNRGSSRKIVVFLKAKKLEKRPDFFRNQAFLVEISGIEPLTS